MGKCDDIGRKVRDGVRLTREEGVALLRDGNFLEIGALADAVRWRKHPEPVVTYIIDRNINYTNVCTAQCAFCAFYRDLPSKEGYLLSKDVLAQKIEETIALGGRQILLQGGLHPDLGIEYYEGLFRWMKATYPIWIHGLSPAEVKHIGKVSGLGTEETLRRLVAAGLDSIPGGGAEILSDRVRKIIGIAKGSTSEWLEVMEVAHRLGMRTTATMMFGHVETLEERIDRDDVGEGIAAERRLSRLAQVEPGERLVIRGDRDLLLHSAAPRSAGVPRSSSSSASSAITRAPRSFGACSKIESPRDCASSIRTW